MILPILQGFLFLMIGLFILSYEVEWAARARAWLIRRFPKAGEAVEDAERRAVRWFEKHSARWNGRPSGKRKAKP